MVPIRKMEEWVGKYRTWRNFVFESYHNRLMEMLEAIDSIAFMKMDERLLKYLHDKVKVTSDIMVHTTHQEIAFTSFIPRGWSFPITQEPRKKLGKIKIHRNKIEVIDRH